MTETRSTSPLAQSAAALRPAPVKQLFVSAAPFLVSVLLAFVLQVTIRPMLGDFYAKLLLDIGTNIILAVSLTMVNGFTGQFSMGHAAFMAVGGYTAACIVYYGSFRIFGDADIHGGIISSMLPAKDIPLATKGDLLFLIATLIGGLVAAVCGYLVGLPSLRLKGDYLAIVTLGFGEIVRLLIQTRTTQALYDPETIAATPTWQLPKYLGGSVGFTGLPFYASLWWAWLFAAVTLIVAFRLKRGTYGRAFLSIREDEIAAEAMGIHTTRYKVRAFVIAAFFAGIAGAIYAHTLGVQLNAGELGFAKSFDLIIMVVLGGLGSISGSALAAVILTILPELLREPPSAWPWGIPIYIVAALAAILLARERRLLRYAIFAGIAAAGWAAIHYSWPSLISHVQQELAAAGDKPGRFLRLLSFVADSKSTWFWLVFLIAAVGARLHKGVIVTVGVLFAWELMRALAIEHGVDLSKYRMVLFALGLILMMLLRPQGLLGIKEVWELRLPRRGGAK